MRRTLLLTLFCSLASAGSVYADGDPIMPLSQVQPGMRCTGYTVVRGTAITQFDVEIQDIVSGDRVDDQPRLLVRVSGPAVDQSGVGPGFSGSPIYCPDDEGTMRNAGAISEGLAEYGNKLVFATPIEAILGEPVEPPAASRRDPALLRSARPFGEPLSFSGLSPRVAAFVQRAAARAHRVVYTAPARPRAAQFPAQELRPGSAMAVGYANGDITAGAVGTVAYTDGDRIWAFGHPLDSVGRRSLFLEDAYVYGIVDNPLGSAELTTYKLAAQGHDLGTLLGDGINAVTGRLGALPPRFGLRIVAHDLDTGRLRVTATQIADETAIGLPTGASPLGIVGPVALAQAAYSILHGAPIEISGSMCARIKLVERPRPLRFCNTYVGGGAGGVEDLGGLALVTDFGTAIAAVDSYRLALLHVSAVDVDVKLRRGLRQAFILGATGPRTARRGSDVRLRVRMQRVRGARFTRTIVVHVPKATRLGRRRLRLTGTPADESPASGDVITLDFGSGADDSEIGPKSVSALAKAVADIHRYDGVRASFTRRSGARVFRDPELRISGTLRVPIRILR